MPMQQLHEAALGTDDILKRCDEKLYVCVCACVCACVLACVRACVPARVCVRLCMLWNCVRVCVCSGPVFGCGFACIHVGGSWSIGCVCDS